MRLMSSVCDTFDRALSYTHNRGTYSRRLLSLSISMARVSLIYGIVKNLELLQLYFYLCNTLESIELNTWDNNKHNRKLRTVAYCIHMSAFEHH